MVLDFESSVGIPPGNSQLQKRNFFPLKPRNKLHQIKAEKHEQNIKWIVRLKRHTVHENRAEIN